MKKVTIAWDTIGDATFIGQKIQVITHDPINCGFPHYANMSIQWVR